MNQNYIAIWVASFTLVTAVPAGVFVTKNGEVGASWGGYSASAGLGGGKTGLHAEAGTPEGHFAGAGVGGSTGGGLYSVAGAPGFGVAGTSNSVASSSASSSVSSSNNINSHQPHKNTFFDDIFNIPQSALRSVAELLNNKNRNPGHTVGVVKTTSSNEVNPPVASAAAAASSSSSSSTSSSHSNSTGNKNYDDIFNIPMSVLGAVNRFLNNIGGHK